MTTTSRCSNLILTVTRMDGWLYLYQLVSVMNPGVFAYLSWIWSSVHDEEVVECPMSRQGVGAALSVHLVS
jgi:hypothetical protein